MSVESLFNNNAVLQGRTQALDAWGGMTETFATSTRFACRIQPTTAEEQTLYARESMIVKLKAYTSHRLDATINNRVTFNSRTFLVRGVTNPDEADVYKVLFLEEQSS